MDVLDGESIKAHWPYFLPKNLFGGQIPNLFFRKQENYFPQKASKHK